MFALGEIEALIAPFTCLLLFLFFPGTLLEKKTHTGVMCQGSCSISAQLNQKEFLTACLASPFVCLAACLPFLLSTNKIHTHAHRHTVLL